MGFEPMIFGTTNRHFDQLSYSQHVYIFYIALFGFLNDTNRVVGFSPTSCVRKTPVLNVELHPLSIFEFAEMTGLEPATL
jgi:hypothetical protein